MFNAVIDAPFGKIGIRCDTQFVYEIVYLPGRTHPIEPDNSLAQRAAEQVNAYLDRPSAAFDLPLAPAGSAFQRRVWQGICEIPPGAVWTYGQLAKATGGVPRAVGQACGSNPFPLVVPCHRVVAANGLGGFAHLAGDGFFRDVKRWLLAHEGVLRSSEGALRSPARHQKPARYR